MAQILLVDDDANLLQMVTLMLTRVGHDVEAAHDGEKALVLAQDLQPDVVIVDVMMPDMSGYEVVEKLRADPRTARIPIIILTARSQPMDKHMALEAGANAFLSKPVTAKELLSRLDAVVKAGVGYRVHTGLLTEPVPPKTLGSAAFANQPAPPVTRPITPPPGQRPGSRLPIGAEDPTQAQAPAPALLPVITLISLRGGTGTTTVAVNLALLLAAARRERVALADLSTTSGHVHLHLHLTAQKNWGRLLDQGDILEPRSLPQIITPHPASGLAVLAAPSQPPPHPLSTAAVQNLLRELNAGFQRQIIDARSLDTAVTGALRVSSAVIVVLADDPPSIQSAGQLLVALQSLGVDPARVRLVLNHIRPKTDVPVDTIQKALKRPLNADLPYEPGHVTAIRRGVPVAMANPDGPYCRALGQLARTLVM